MTIAREVGIVVVGAGPAGLEAALEARRLGAQVLVVDEYESAGGQYHRQPALADADAAWPEQPEQVRRGRTLAEEAARAGVELWTAATVWGVFPGRILGIDRDGTPAKLRAGRLVIATGAHDRCMAFPGWTLPGVMTPGAAQTLVKAHGVLPGRRVVVAGSGPFLLVVAAELAKAGARVELVEAARWNWSVFGRFLHFPGRWPELARLGAALAAHRVRLHLGRAVVEAVGEGRVRGVVTRRLDRDGRPVPGTERRHDADALCVAFGFRAQSELGRLAGCRHDYREAEGGAVIAVDRDTGQTSAEGIFAAGEATGVAGNEVARAEGIIAGLSAARSLGRWDDAADRRLAAARRDRERSQRFADLVNGSFAAPAGLADIVTPETIVCRCEAVTRAAIDGAIEAGARSTSAVKMWTRCGMGRCQGRICGWTLASLLARRLGLPAAEVDTQTPRVPAKPVPLARVLALARAVQDRA